VPSNVIDNKIKPFTAPPNMVKSKKTMRFRLYTTQGVSLMTLLLLAFAQAQSAFHARGMSPLIGWL